jgi:Flp pilus assembly protein TadB
MPLPTKKMDELERALAAAQARTEKVRSSVEEMRAINAEGQEASRKLIRIVLGIGLVLFLIASAVLLSEPRARGAYIFLVACLLGAGVWSYFRAQRGD